MGLVISRATQEAVEIRTPAGERITVRVLSVRGEEVRLLFTAPREVIVHREEVWERLASQTPPAP